MYRLNKLLGIGKSAKTPHDRDAFKTFDTQAYRDKRKISGQRVSCTCEFVLPSIDPFSQHKIKTHGVMMLNVRGCSFYCNEPLTAEEAKQIFPQFRLTVLKDLVLTGQDAQKFALSKLSIRCVRLISDENGLGVIMRFVNLNEDQLDMLCGISERYANKPTG